MERCSVSNLLSFGVHKTRGLKDNLYHVPCLGHIINLAVQAILGPRGLNDEPPKNNNLYLDDDEDDAATEPSDTPAKKLTTLQKLRKGIVKIKYSAVAPFNLLVQYLLFF